MACCSHGGLETRYWDLDSEARAGSRHRHVTAFPHPLEIQTVLPSLETAALNRVGGWGDALPSPSRPSPRGSGAQPTGDLLFRLQPIVKADVNFQRCWCVHRREVHSPESRVQVVCRAGALSAPSAVTWDLSRQYFYHQMGPHAVKGVFPRHLR